MRREGSDGQHSLAGGILGKGDTIVARNHYHCSSPDLPKVIVIVSDRSDQRVLQHGGEPERQKIGSTVQRLATLIFIAPRSSKVSLTLKKSILGLFIEFVSSSVIPVSTSAAAAYLDTLGSIPPARLKLVMARSSRRFIAGMR